jgi:uncharacterized membrane protein
LSLQPLLSAPLAVQVHAFAAMLAFAAGALQFALPKGTPGHRALGWTWVLTMVLVAVVSFWINTIRQFGPFSWIHLLSIYTLVILAIGVHAARQGNIRLHRAMMFGTFLGALVIAGGFTLLPGRIMHKVLFGG